MNDREGSTSVRVSVAGPDRSADEDATRTDATCLVPDDDERLWQVMSSSKREANGKVVEMILKPVKASA
jgi:hypothetical protein